MAQKYKTSARRAPQKVALWPYIHRMENPLTWDEFERVEMRVGLVVDAAVFEEATAMPAAAPSSCTAPSKIQAYRLWHEERKRARTDQNGG